MKILFTLFLLALTASSAYAQCKFVILVTTGDKDDAGTEARISLSVSTANGKKLVIKSLKPWGQKGHNNFEKGHTDTFKGSGKCLLSKPCRMLLESNGKGNKPGWFVDKVAFTQIEEKNLSQKEKTFNVNRWLARDESPDRLFVIVDDCAK
uniref:PLAT domain-containing protein n=1 Tax=Triticum urartu TaxID=4572 RepID=A0A8R7TPE3_TRIUA